MSVILPRPYGSKNDCDVDRYHSDSFTTILASITPSSSQKSNVSRNSQQVAPSQHNFTTKISPSLSLKYNISAQGKPHHRVSHTC